MKNQTINQILRKAAAGTVLAGVALLLTTALSASADNSCFKPEIIPPGPQYSWLLAEYWQWSLSFPANADPAGDTAPQESNQSGPVWFLAGIHASAVNGGSGTVSRQITMPTGTALFFPILSIYGDDSGCPVFTNLTVNELRAVNAGDWSYVTETTCTIDGVAVKGLANPQTSRYLIQSPPFSYTLASSNNLLAADYGEPCIPDGMTIYPAVAEGMCLLLAPLPPGNHTIHFVGIVGPVESPFVYFDETYEVTVKLPVKNHIK
ncbi:MAG TPA: hypothetical protein VMA13_03715 [Candidatus Saccharimonadales bacterium]|nr:hypothetical protein [Candidatus Saccharimonadales bacterium]